MRVKIHVASGGPGLTGQCLADFFVPTGPAELRAIREQGRGTGADRAASGRIARSVPDPKLIDLPHHPPDMRSLELQCGLCVERLLPGDRRVRLVQQVGDPDDDGAVRHVVA